VITADPSTLWTKKFDKLNKSFEIVKVRVNASLSLELPFSDGSGSDGGGFHLDIFKTPPDLNTNGANSAPEA
jgi:hypothetical protein